MFTCHCCQRFIYVNKLSCTTDEGLTPENFGSYHYTILLCLHSYLFTTGVGNIYLYLYIHTFHAQYTGPKPLIYRRYIDDIFGTTTMSQNDLLNYTVSMISMKP